MELEQLNEIRKRLKNLSIMEIDYFRNWLMDKYPIYAMSHDIYTIIDTMEGVKAGYNDVMNILNNINDKNKWVLDVSYFINNENNGYYRIVEAQQIIDKLSKNNFLKYLNYLKDKYPIYKTKEELDYVSINNSFGEENYPKWDEIYEIVKYDLYKK